MKKEFKKVNISEIEVSVYMFVYVCTWARMHVSMCL